ncbi:hypothetical protein KKC22_17605 [Myxococcota bacterium]|nr:hypothetical protein [Myxococcota bacterium]
MRKYHSGASAALRTDYGIELIAGLEQFMQTQPLAGEFRPINDTLITLELDKPPLVTALTIARAGVRVANYQFDRVIRQIARDCELADGGRRGPVFAAVFPSNVNCVIAPGGVGQVTAGDAFVRQLEASNVAGVAPVREAWFSEVKTRLDQLKAAVAARDEAGQRLAVFRARELALCEDHEYAVERVMGQVRALFPRQRDLWNAIFPPAPRASRNEDSEADPETDPLQV